MSEHIKTGFVIFDVSHPIGKQWVDVEWLKGEIEKHQRAFDYGSYWINVVTLLKLLEE